MNEVGKEYLQAREFFEKNPYNINPYKQPVRRRVQKRSSNPRRDRRNIETIKKIRKNYKKNNNLMELLNKRFLLIATGIFLAIKYLNGIGISKIEGNIEDGTGATGIVNYKNAHMSEAGKKQLKSDEGCYLYTYDDKGPFDKNGRRVPLKPGDKIIGTPTIGYGHTKGVKPGMTISQAEADKLLEEDILEHEKRVKEQLSRNNITTPITQNMFDAMVNYAFNNGSLGKKFLANLKSGNYRGAQAELEVGGANAKRMARLREVFGRDISSDNKLVGTPLELSKTKSLGGYKLKGGAKVSDEMQRYLNSTGGKGYITSGMELTSEHATGAGRTKYNPSKNSHYYGLKIDVVPSAGGIYTDQQWAETAIPFLRSPATEFVDFEAFTRNEFLRIRDLIFKLAPDVKPKCNESFLKNSAANQNTTGKHLDIKIKEGYNYAKSPVDDYNKINKDQEKAKAQQQRINQSKNKQEAPQEQENQQDSKKSMNIPANNKVSRNTNITVDQSSKRRY